jgi:hypothetical protein
MFVLLDLTQYYTFKLKYLYTLFYNNLYDFNFIYKNIYFIILRFNLIEHYYNLSLNMLFTKSTANMFNNNKFIFLYISSYLK